MLVELIYSMKTSNHQVDGEGCSWRQTFTDAAGGMHWDHVFVTELLSNSSYRPVHDYIMGAEYVAVARIRQALAEVPRRYLKCSGCCRCRTGTARSSIATRRSPR